MKILNLDPNFTPLGKGCDFNIMTFPSGFEHHVKLPPLENEDVTVTIRIRSSDDIMFLLLLSDALERVGARKKNLFIPYLPYARQDRVMVSGEPLSLKVMGNIINSLHFEKVTILDPHSRATELVIDRLISLDNSFLVRTVLSKKHNDYLLVSPDSGAQKKIYYIAQKVGYIGDILLASKARDVSTGRIKHIHVDETDFSGKELVIVDDICDGGMTFILLAKKLRELGAKKISLIVTHGIFSKGEKLLSQYLDAIYTTDSISDQESKFITRYKIKDLLKINHNN